MKRAFLIAAIAIILSPVGHAQQPKKLSVFMTALEKQGLAHEGKFYDQISGAARGFVAANEHLKLDKAPPLYCPPDPLSLRGSNFVDIALREYRRNQMVYDNLPPDLSDFSPLDTAVIILLRGLRHTFPCK
jgi:hypothetical protein